MPFKALNLDSEIVKALVEAGYTKPTPIQETAIPKILDGCDLLASAQTGSGKTAAFILPALNRLKTTPAKPGTGPRILILVPTRELAMQVATQAVKYSKYMDRVKTVCLYGGAPYPVQNRQLARPYDILVATPGRLIDQYDSGRIDFSRVELFVLDEADRMLDMGFISSVEKLSSVLPKRVQTVLFSATLEGEIMRLAKDLLHNPVEIKLASNKLKHENIEQCLYYADNLSHKMRLLDHLLQDETIKQAIIFTSTKFFANELVLSIKEMGHAVGVLHGDLNQRQRTNTTRQLREGKISLLVATDVAARGIDIPAISHVFNFDLPTNLEDYTHRIGRTGRADAKGLAISFALVKDGRLVESIEKFIGKAIEKRIVEGMEPTARESRSSRAPSRGNRFSGSKGRSNDSRGERRSYSDKPNGERRSYSDKPSGERKSYSDRPAGERKSFSDRPTGERKSYSDRPAGERKSFSDRPAGERKSYSDRPSGERKSYSDRPTGERKSYSDRPTGERKSFSDRPAGERKSYSDRPAGERKSYSDRPKSKDDAPKYRYNGKPKSFKKD